MGGSRVPRRSQPERSALLGHDTPEGFGREWNPDHSKRPGYESRPPEARPSWADTVVQRHQSRPYDPLREENRAAFIVIDGQEVPFNTPAPAALVPAVAPEIMVQQWTAEDGNVYERRGDKYFVQRYEGMTLIWEECANPHRATPAPSPLQEAAA